jgi:hypothetical protein
MGYHIHHAIVVTSWSEQRIKAAHDYARIIFAKLDACVSEITPAVVNGYTSFFIAPDGSKEGWPESNACDIARDEFFKKINSLDGYVDAVEVSFGGDEPSFNTEIIRYNEYIEEEI